MSLWLTIVKTIAPPAAEWLVGKLKSDTPKPKQEDADAARQGQAAGAAAHRASREAGKRD